MCYNVVSQKHTLARERTTHEAHLHMYDWTQFPILLAALCKEGEMKLCTAHAHGHALIGLARTDEWINLGQMIQDHAERFPWLAARPEPTIIDLLENTPDLLGTVAHWYGHLQETGKIGMYRLQEPLQLLAPITRPSKIVALGRNYVEHAREGGHEVPDEPILFAKAPSAVIGPGGDIIYPQGVQRLDPELELGVVIGRRARFVGEAEAPDYVAGYTIVNDVTARDLQRRDQEKKWPWLRSKSFDTFCPLGPHLVLQDEIADPQQLELTLRVNGEIRQRSTTAKMIFGVRQLIAFISQYMTLEPGDVIATGTPEGIAPVNRGDLLAGTITGLGTLVNRVV
jgi:5-oxopent-3-ene-1,2,5-tricarboxylate decarboxylase/2-hydroxyhepta-2,4-diene-1,7-dioate isomerase